MDAHASRPTIGSQLPEKHNAAMEKAYEEVENGTQIPHCESLCDVTCPPKWASSWEVSFSCYGKKEEKSESLLQLCMLTEI